MRVLGNAWGAVGQETHRATIQHQSALALKGGTAAPLLADEAQDAFNQLYGDDVNRVRAGAQLSLHQAVLRRSRANPPKASSESVAGSGTCQRMAW